jgi:type III pantothenate kinase
VKLGGFLPDSYWNTVTVRDKIYPGGDFMELLADVGNTTTIFGLHNSKSVICVWRLPSSRLETEDEIFAILDGLFRSKGFSFSSLDGFCVASVVPRLNRSLQYFAARYLPFSAVFLKPDRFVSVGLKTDNPAEIGADRLANVIGAARHYGPNAIVIDVGTAITIDVLKDNVFVGGSILPGPATAMSALFSKTAKLPEVELFFEDHYLGTNTEDNIRIGIVNGTYFALQGIVKNLQKNFSERTQVIGTGGNVELFMIEDGFIDTNDQDLTLKGIRAYYDRVKASEKSITG